MLDWSVTVQIQHAGEGNSDTHLGEHCQVAERWGQQYCLASVHRWAVMPLKPVPLTPEHSDVWMKALLGNREMWKWRAKEHCVSQHIILGLFVFVTSSMLLLFHSQWVVVWLLGNCPERTETGSVWREGRRPPGASPLRPQSMHLYDKEERYRTNTHHFFVCLLIFFMCNHMHSTQNKSDLFLFFIIF